MNYTDIEVVYCQPDPQYRKAAGESQSHLKSILTSPAHYQAVKKRKFFSSSVMTIGTATHCKALEGEETFASHFVKKPDHIKFTTKEGRDWREANSKKTILINDGKDAQWDSVLGMTETLRTLDWFNPDQPDYRKYNEVSIYWKADGIPCKARLDRVLNLEDETIVLDLKTTDSVSIDKFQSKLVDLGYDFQAGWYSKAAELVYGKPVRFIFVAIERNSPYTMDLFEVPPLMLEEAQRKNKKALSMLSECINTNEWPTREPSLKLLSYPKWYQPSQEEFPNAADPGFVPLF